MKDLPLRFNEYPIKFDIFLLGLKEKSMQNFSAKMQVIFEKNEAEIVGETYRRKRFSNTRDNFYSEIIANIKEVDSIMNEIRTTFSKDCDHISILTSEQEFEIITDAEYEASYLKKD